MRTSKKNRAIEEESKSEISAISEDIRSEKSFMSEQFDHEVHEAAVKRSSLDFMPSENMVFSLAGGIIDHESSESDDDIEERKAEPEAGASLLEGIIGLLRPEDIDIKLLEEDFEDLPSDRNHGVLEALEKPHLARPSHYSS